MNNRLNSLLSCLPDGALVIVAAAFALIASGVSVAVVLSLAAVATALVCFSSRGDKTPAVQPVRIRDERLSRRHRDNEF